MKFPSSYAIINPCFTAGKISGVGNCHAAWRHQKTTVCTSIVYGTMRPKQNGSYNNKWLHTAIDLQLVNFPQKINADSCKYPRHSRKFLARFSYSCIDFCFTTWNRKMNIFGLKLTRRVAKSERDPFRMLSIKRLKDALKTDNHNYVPRECSPLWRRRHSGTHPGRSVRALIDHPHVASITCFNKRKERNRWN